MFQVAEKPVQKSLSRRALTYQPEKKPVRAPASWAVAAALRTKPAGPPQAGARAQEEQVLAQQVIRVHL